AERRGYAERRTRPEQRVGGRQIVDLRTGSDPRALLDEMSAHYGERLLIWAEGLTAPLEGACTRVDLLGRQALALALATPPPDPQALRAVLEAVDPQLVHLLPPLPQEELTLEHVLRSVLGMVRAAISKHGGQLALASMAARLGLPEATILLALEYLEAAGKLTLHREGDALSATPGGPGLGLDDLDALRSRQRRALARMLAEAQAYREAWAVLPAEALLAASDK
ncbi:MAG: hypothetical protein JXA74_16690, partial [Anaerolineae bacterium]|nr:hypothetical protein [Anaerolineae bacterium]